MKPSLKSKKTNIMKIRNWKPIVSAVFITGLLSFNIISATADRPAVAEKNGNTEIKSGAVVAYAVNVKKSNVVWTGKKVSGSHTGNITLSSGNVLVDKNTITGGTFIIDTRTITSTDVTDADTNAKLVGHLKNDDFFGVDKYPEAKLVITSLLPEGQGKYTVKADLTIKDKTNPVTFPATISVNGKQVNANAKIVVDRSKYDIKFRSKSFFENLGDKVIYDDFDLDVQLVADAQ